MIRTKLITLCICPVLATPPVVLSVSPKARQATAAVMHRAADRLAAPKRKRTPAPVAVAADPCPPPGSAISGGPVDLLPPGWFAAPGTPGRAWPLPPASGYDDGNNGSGLPNGPGGTPGQPDTPPLPPTPDTPAVPEPLTWFMMIVGFILAGLALRYRITRRTA